MRTLNPYYLLARKRDEEMAERARKAHEAEKEGHTGDSESTPCTHERAVPQIVDQTLGVYCKDCGFNGACWSDEHVSEAMWNLACKNDTGANPCKQSRANVCFLCEEAFDPEAPQ